MAHSSTDSMPESSTSHEQTPAFGFRRVRSVLLCGASVRSLAESAISAGLRPICADFFEDADLMHLLSRGRGRFAGRLDSFSDLPQMTHSVRRSIPLLWAGGLENHTDILRTIASRRPVIGANPDLIDRLRNPVTLGNWLTEAGLHVPRLATDAIADPDCLWLRKPIASSGGFGIRAVSQSTSNSSTNELPDSDEYLQEYVDGVSMSAVLCSDEHGIELFGTSLQLIGWPSLGASGFRFCGNIGPIDPGESVTRQVLTAAKIIVEKSGLIGVFGIDFILSQSRAWFLEVNPRPTASHMLYEPQGLRGGQSGNLIRRHLAAFGWRTTNSALEYTGPLKSRPAERLTSARLIIWAESIFKVPRNPEPKIITGSSLQMRVTDVPIPGSVIPAGSPICSVQMSAATGYQLVELMSRIKESEGFFSLISWQRVSQQVQLILDRFEQNCRCVSGFRLSPGG